MADNDYRSPNIQPTPPERRLPWRYLAWVLVAGVALVAGWQVVKLIVETPGSAPDSAATAVIALTSTPSATAAAALYPTPDPGFVSDAEQASTTTPVSAPAALPAREPAPPPTLAADETLLRITPSAGQAGWVTSIEARGNHFGDSFLHAGIAQSQLFHSAIQLDLERLPRGAPIRYAALQLTGLDDKRLDRAANNAWSVRWLDPAVNEDWSRKSFQDIHNAPVFQTLLPPLGQGDLAPLAINQFVLSSEQLRLLEQAIIANETQFALRIDGPEVGPDDLFTWDSGYGPATQGSPPILEIVVGPAPATPPPIPTEDYIVVTSTPTPANVLTAAAIVVQATAQATQVGTATPTPRTMVTATPTPENALTAEAQRLLAGLPLVTTPTPEPENGATAAAIAAYATAVALTTGTFTPLPTDYVTATPFPPEAIVTNTPTAASIFQLLDRAIVEATRTATAGPPTPMPAGVVTATPTRTSTPAPLNAETVQAQIILVTIEALTTGTWTPTPTRTPAPLAGPPGTPTAPPALTPLAPVAITLVDGAPQGVVTSDRINVRAGPGTRFAVVGVLPIGTRLSLVGRSDDSGWLVACCVGGQSVWLAQFLVQPDVNIADLPVQPAPTGLLDRVLDVAAARRKATTVG